MHLFYFHSVIVNLQLAVLSILSSYLLGSHRKQRRTSCSIRSSRLCLDYISHRHGGDSNRVRSNSKVRFGTYNLSYVGRIWLLFFLTLCLFYSLKSNEWFNYFEWAVSLICDILRSDCSFHYYYLLFLSILIFANIYLNHMLTSILQLLCKLSFFWK